MSEDVERSWVQLLAAKRGGTAQPRYRITLRVRGREIVKEYYTEEEFRRWRETYHDQMGRENSGIEDLRAESI